MGQLGDRRNLNPTSAIFAEVVELDTGVASGEEESAGSNLESEKDDNTYQLKHV